MTCTEKELLFYLYKECATDPVYCPRESLKTLEDIEYFLRDAHKFSNLSFSHKGNLLYRNPFQMFQLFQKWYKVSHFGNGNILNMIETQPPFYRYRNVNFSENLFLFSENALLNIYAKQLLCEDDVCLEDHENWNINLPMIPDTCYVADIPKKYQNILNILLEISMGFQEKKDQDKFLNLFQNNLKAMANIYTYAKYLVKFKLQRNIL
jgi:hypothetical protein